VGVISLSCFGNTVIYLMATFELYRRSTIGMCLTETLDEMVSNGTLSPELAIQVLVQFDKVS
jgi:transcription initiation factor TFIIA small subunit